MMRYAEPSGWESWCSMPNQWLRIMVCYADPVGVNHIILSVVWILVYHAEPVVVNHAELSCASGNE